MAPAIPLSLVLLASASGALRVESFEIGTPAEVTAIVSAACARCSWAEPGREAAVLVLELDGVYSQHLVLVRGEPTAPYEIALGPLAAGPHRLAFRLDRQATPRALGEVQVRGVSFHSSKAGEADQRTLAFAPLVYARPGTVERFSDLPLVMWCESETTARGTRLRYSVVFTNEDGGTPIDRLMATWGRTTDVEFAYGVELDGKGRVLEETYQAEGHGLVPFQGRHEGRRPLLWVVTDNNMFGERGTTTVRFAPAPRLVDLASRSREAVMDETPWTYRLSSQEARREGRVAAGALPGTGQIPDPRRFAFLEACAPGEDASLSFALGVAARDGLAWYASDAGGPKFRVTRGPHNFPNGCFQAAVALPPGTEPSAIRALRVSAFTRLPAEKEAPLPPGTGRARLLRVNRLFVLNDHDEPGPNLYSWAGDLPLVGEGPPAELTIAPR